MFESLLEALKDIQIEGDKSTCAGTFDVVQDLCRTFERLEITEIVESFDQDAERIILTAVTEAREFKLASLTSSDLANSVADLARHLHHITDLLDPDSETTPDSHVSFLSREDGAEAGSSPYSWNLSREVAPAEDERVEGRTTPTQALPFPVFPRSSRWSANDSVRCQTTPSRGLTYPSALSDVLNVSGCNIPS